MAYITAQEVQAIRNALKARFPEFKFGCRKGSGGLSVDVTIKQGPVDFIGDYNATVEQRPGGYRGGSPARDNLQINPYWYEEHFSKEVADVVGEIVRVVKTAPDRKWYDNSDIQTDYFETAYYFHIEVGTWNKPYILTK